LRFLNRVFEPIMNTVHRTAESRELEARSTAPRFEAYARPILEMLRSDPMLFIRGDGLSVRARGRGGASSTGRG
jgi:hypothetical protein